MDTIIKDLPLPKEAKQLIEEVPVFEELLEPEPQGIGWGTGIGIAAVVVIVAAVAKYKCKCKK